MTISVKKRLEDLVKIGESMVWFRSPEPISQGTIDTLKEALDCECLIIHLLDVTGEHLVRFSDCEELTEQELRFQRIPITTGRLSEMITTHQPIIMDILHPDPADVIPDDLTRFRSGISVPLLAGDDVLGMYTILYKQYQCWTEQEIDQLMYIGRLLGIMVQHAQVARKSADLEILRERKRLSGELHDQLSQLIISLKMSAEAALLSWEEGDTNRIRSDLERIRDTGQEAARTLREEMLSLRTPANETKGLVPFVRECLHRFEHQWKIKTDLRLEDGLEPLIVSTQMEVQLLRILHESLTNVLRHATASHVTVIFQGDQNHLCMQIQDNGQGFDPESVSGERLGLRIMRERAESLGGQLFIRSCNGKGTTIHVEVPLYV